MTISNVRIYALWTLKVWNKCAHICAKDPQMLIVFNYIVQLNYSKMVDTYFYNAASC